MSNHHAEFEGLEERLRPKPLRWQNFEAEVAAYLEKEMEFCNLGLNPATGRVLSAPQYFSKLRGSNITFDVSIEVWPYKDAERPTLIWLWECKDYPNRNVTVDEVEEFNDTIRQVGAHKGTIVTRKGFASGSVALARSYGIALMTLEKEQVACFAFSQDAGIIERIALKSRYCLYTWGDEVAGPELDALLQAELSKAGLMN